MAWFTPSSPCILFLISASLLRSQALPASCPPGWLEWHQSCYILLPDKMNWFEASEACNRPGSSLVVPNSREENLFIWKSMVEGAEGLWIGCTDAAQEGVWMCGGQAAQYTDWAVDFPSVNDEMNCARITVYNKGRWRHDVPCDIINDRKSAACEMPVFAAPAYHTFSGPAGRVPQQCLLHHDIKNLTVKGVLACGWACRADPRCRSFNLWQNSKREKTCQLNDVTRLGADRIDFAAVNDCYYFDL
ncbi:perlucin-like protein [Patiria miniata]|uniref:C-type lectin domain-containing protein n=1 Tax=Patiria miniata TaxID=46514 RepID=A0A914BHM3_PATMI|nr:perlucin-like protein [Patiria miniata]